MVQPLIHTQTLTFLVGFAQHWLVKVLRNQPAYALTPSFSCHPGLFWPYHPEDLSWTYVQTLFYM